MANADQLIDALKKVLRTRGVTYAALARGVGLSEASIKRLFSEKTFTLQRLDAICRWLELDLFELARLARGDAESVLEMTVAQEQVLADDRKLLGVFYLLLNNWTLAEMVATYELGEPECIRLLIRLERAGLIELLPGNRVRLRVSRRVRHRSDGPIRRRHGEAMLSDFLGVRFDEHGGHFRFEVGELSKASAAILQRKLDRLAAEFHELSALDINLPAPQRRLYGVALGTRPWNGAAEISGLKLRKGAAPARAAAARGQAGRG